MTDAEMGAGARAPKPGRADRLPSAEPAPFRSPVERIEEARNLPGGPKTAAAGSGDTPFVAPRPLRAFALVNAQACAAAHAVARALHMHVAGTCRPSALRNLADLGAAQGIANHAFAGRAHRRDWWLALAPLALDPQSEGRS